MAISTEIVRVVSVATNRRPTDLEPLGCRIDVDELDALYGPGFLSDAEVSATVTFSYDGHVVEIDSDGTIGVRGAPE